MRLVCISDTHSRHRHMLVGSETRLRSGPVPPQVPDGDVLIHAGDCTASGTLSQLEDVVGWMSDFPHEHKILIAGNHDSCFVKQNQESRAICKEHGITYLQGEAVTIEGLKFYGFPWQPIYRDMSFNAAPGELWGRLKLVPDDTDVLISHGPALGIFDFVPRDREHVGSYEIAQTIDRLPQLKAHICGHIHEGYGFAVRDSDGIKFVNASTCTANYQPTNPAIIIDL